MKGKNIIITGAYGAIGTAIAEQVAARGHRLFLIGRQEEKIHTLCRQIQRKSRNKEIYAICSDLSEGTEIRDLANRWKEPVDILINGAATAPKQWSTNSDGTELQFAVNVLSYFYMMHFFAPLMEPSSDARIINIASHWAGNFDMNDLEFRERPYFNDEAYRQSKQAIRMLGPVFAENFRKTGITVNSCHPGFVDSQLTRDLGLGGHETAEHAAKTPLYLTLSDDVKNKTGLYFERAQEVSCHFASDNKRNRYLYLLCTKYLEKFVSNKPSIKDLY